MTEKRFNCHVKFSAMPNGIMVLDYEKHGDEQTVIEDISREKAHRVMDRLNELNDENEQLKSDNNRLVNETAKIVAEHQGRILDLIDEKIEHYQKQPLLAVRISTNCEYWKSCMYNQEINVCNKAKENAYRELKKELLDD